MISTLSYLGRFIPDLHPVSSTIYVQYILNYERKQRTNVLKCGQVISILRPFRPTAPIWSHHWANSAVSLPISIRFRVIFTYSLLLTKKGNRLSKYRNTAELPPCWHHFGRPRQNCLNTVRTRRLFTNSGSSPIFMRFRVLFSYRVLLSCTGTKLRKD